MITREQIIEAMAQALVNAPGSETRDLVSAALDAAIPRLILTILDAHASFPELQNPESGFWLDIGFEKAIEAVERFRILEQTP